MASLDATHRSPVELEVALDHIRSAPATDGWLALIVRRPAVDEREILEEAQLEPSEGLVGDSWAVRRSARTGAEPQPDRQLTLINARLSLVIGGSEERAALAGDQLHVDLDLGEANLPPGTRLRIGEAAVIEITDPPHTGCQKFSQRFGPDALRFVNSPPGRELRLRGVYARVVVPGTIWRGDSITVV